MKTVLIVDEDLGFAFWLGHLLDAAAYLAMPARSVSDAMRLVAQLELTVDVLVVNLALSGAIDFIGALQQSDRDVRVVGVLNGSVEMANIPRVNAVHFKGTAMDEAAKGEWLDCVQGVLSPIAATAGSRLT